VQNRAKEVKTNSVSLNGLDDVFDVDTTVISEVDQADSRVSNEAERRGLTIRQASEHYGFAVPTIRLKIKVGEIPAVKLDGPKGPEWRIFPKGVPEALKDTDISLQTGFHHADIHEAEESQQPDKSLAEGFHQANMNVASLIKINQEMMAKLESASHRNGYLESQLAEKESQIKLLPDYQLQAERATQLENELKVQARSTESLEQEVERLRTELTGLRESWWHKFGYWFIGKK
jgi:hypothetical protein